MRCAGAAERLRQRPGDQGPIHRQSIGCDRTGPAAPYSNRPGRGRLSPGRAESPETPAYAPALPRPVARNRSPHAQPGPPSRGLRTAGRGGSVRQGRRAPASAQASCLSSADAHWHSGSRARLDTAQLTCCRVQLTRVD
jgi:hypothetical protein